MHGVNLGITPLVASVVFPVVGVLIFQRVERRSRILGDMYVH